MKRSRGRPKGSKNKKTVDVEAIEREISAKKQEDHVLKQQYDTMKQKYQQFHHFLSNPQRRQQQIFQQVYTAYMNQPQYSRQYQPQQIQAFAQQTAMTQWSTEANSTQQQMERLRQQIQAVAQKIKAGQIQLQQLNAQKDDALRSTPSGPIADFEVNYI